MSQTVDLTTFSYTVLSLLTAKAQPENLRSSLAPPIMSCVTLSELLNLSEHQYSPLSKGDNNSIYLLVLTRELNEIMRIKHLGTINP